MTFLRPASLAARLALVLAAPLPATALHAQQEETPVTFDSAQRMTAITPMLAERLKLQAPAWPVSGTFREARLYAAGDGKVLVVQRTDGTLVRYALDAAASEALQQAVEQGMRLSGNPAGEPDAYTYTEVAGTRFAKRQLIYGTLLYGPLLASFASDGNTGTALYLTGAAVPSLMGMAFARDGVLTRAQTDLGTDATLRWALLGSFAHRAWAGDNEGDSHAATVLAASLTGTATGLAFGRKLTDGEAASMIAGSNYLLGITSGVMGSMGAFDDKCTTTTTTTWDGYPYSYDDCESDISQGEWGTLLAAGVVGYPLGLAYSRRRAYTVTAGDAHALLVPGVLGALAGLTAVGDGADDNTTWGVVTGGLVLGLVAGDRLLVKPFDYTRSNSTALRVGALAGGLIGLIPPALAESEDTRAIAGGALLGATLGTAFAHQMVKPRRAQSREVLRVGSAVGTSGASRVPDVPDAATMRTPRVQWQVDPAGLAMVAARAPGRHGILSITF